ncbi:uncharacterized protein TNIN_138661 [Trichonephila inaurata madagascariensis]|uniref:EF-hand domain-containing protein n=1 Tax=Trichonephila inaurata madagascariensis TaxID=2747483 RepID=A0A8X6XGG6_9ARAC|nr:uncharacterized protein TNIN_138661 [Trichonephila inaurata madagascariensis]
MSEYSDKSEKVYIGRSRNPHCETCVCPKETKIRSKVVIKSRPQRYRRSPPLFSNKNCVCDCHYPYDDEYDIDEKFYETKEQVTISPTRLERRVHADHKYGLLENWFKRFDFDCNGLIDLFELRTMLNFLGVSVGDDYCKRLLRVADRDRDGCLTFPEFLLMWREAQEDEELIQIIREHDLYPDVLTKNFYRTPPRTKVTETTVKRKYGHNPHHCDCGTERTVTKTYRRSPKDSSVEIRAKVSHRSMEKLPILSFYR